MDSELLARKSEPKTNLTTLLLFWRTGFLSGRRRKGAKGLV